MHLIGAIIIGFVVGLLARFFKPGNDKMGWLMTTVLGVVGALFATFLGRWVGWYGPEEPAGFLASIVGAVIVLGAWAGFSRRGGTRAPTLTNRDRWAA